uniref:Uncharacterized protein n=1 Tax=uncultured marine virus TaxID=186617 RepID=A0A0F7LBI4_9VIRU|nr:hypothetical protein [uncultured marine virus]
MSRYLASFSSSPERKFIDHRPPFDLFSNWVRSCKFQGACRPPWHSGMMWSTSYLTPVSLYRDCAVLKYSLTNKVSP